MNTLINRMLTHYPKLLSYAWRLTNNKEDAKDLVQETYLKALERQHYYKQENNLYGWLGLMLKRIWLDRNKSPQAQTIYKDEPNHPNIGVLSDIPKAIDLKIILLE